MFRQMFNISRWIISLLLLFIVVVTLDSTDVNAQGGYTFSEFRAPYDTENKGVKFSGGPHAWGADTTVVTIPIQDGSGIDFAGDSFEVLAMASGKIVELRRSNCTSGEYDLGCKIAIKHHVGGTVLIYGHLAENTIPQSLTVGDNVSQGDPLGTAGNTESPGNQIHLHLELRTGQACSGSRHCYKTVSGSQLGNALNWGNWGQGAPKVDGFWIVNYAIQWGRCTYAEL